MNNHEFQLLPLDKIEYLFNTSERKRLAKYGNWAKSLEQGDAAPNTGRQEHFVSVCHGIDEPETDFEFLWFSYRAAIETDMQIAELIGLVSSTKHEANGLRKSLFEQISYSQKQEALIKKLQNTLTSYERKLGLIEPPKSAVTTETGERNLPELLRRRWCLGTVLQVWRFRLGICVTSNISLQRDASPASWLRAPELAR